MSKKGVEFDATESGDPLLDAGDGQTVDDLAASTPPEEPEDDSTYTKEEKEGVLDEYQQAIGDAEIAAVGTATEFWGHMHKLLAGMQDEARVKLETEDKPREIVREQVTIAVVNSIAEKVRSVAENVKAVFDAYPLFVHTFEKTASFNESTGAIVLADNPRYGKEPKGGKKASKKGKK